LLNLVNLFAELCKKKTTPGPRTGFSGFSFARQEKCKRSSALSPCLQCLLEAGCRVLQLISESAQSGQSGHASANLLIEIAFQQVHRETSTFQANKDFAKRVSPSQSPATLQTVAHVF